MSDLEIFGPIVLATDVEDAIEVTMKKWMPDYLAFTERHIGKPAEWLPRPNSYTVTSDWDAFPEESVPAVLIMCPAVDKPLMDGQREYRATFPVRVGIRVESKDRRSSERLAKFYGGAFRALLLAKGSLGNFAEATTWLGEEYGTHISDRTQRTFGTADVKLNIEVRNVVRRLTGPAVPSTKPETEPADLPRFTKGAVTIVAQHI